MAATVILGILAGLYLVLGVMGLLFPKVSRRLIAVFVHRTPTRYLGIVTLVVGALMFRYNTATPFPLFAKALGFAIFVVGGAQLLIPDLVIVFNEWWGMRNLWWERALGVIYIALAAFFLVSASPAGYVESTSARPKPEQTVQSKPSPATTQTQPSPAPGSTQESRKSKISGPQAARH